MKFTSCRQRRLGSPSVMEDAKGEQYQPLFSGSIQETGQEQRPARMVGLSSLDLAKSSKDAGWKFRVQSLRREGGV